MKLPDFTEEQIEEMAKNIAKEMEESQKKRRAFYESARFKEVMDQIKQIVKESKGIADNPYREPLFGDVSNEEFIQVFSIVYDKDILDLEITESDEGFWHTVVAYEGLEFVEINGQGTAFIVNLAK